MKWLHFYLLLVFVFSTSPTTATVIIDKKDLKLFNLHPLRIIPSELTPTRIEYSNHSMTQIKAYIEKNNEIINITSPIQLSECLGDKVTVIQEMNSHLFSISVQKNKYYKIKAEIKCDMENHLFFKSDSPEGELVQIWQILSLAENFFKNIQRIQFWQNKINVQWPSRGDYYWQDVNITNGQHWDVVAHELGHAIYDQAKIGKFGGGAHKIDECYNSNLALSEGWATFFAGWITLDLHAPDPAFEYLVPRRAPIQIENVPPDRCKGPTNEWRVSSYLWDIVDYHSENIYENTNLPFTTLWDVFQNGDYNNINEIHENINFIFTDKSLIDYLWQFNFE
ncbi:MAG: hypothetical protein KDD40_01945 [Bdellovibrionales bacterium]|nr:hypothetical protein [Bdellovibrionales bacterium]